MTKAKTAKKPKAKKAAVVWVQSYGPSGGWRTEEGPVTLYAYQTVRGRFGAQAAAEDGVAIRYGHEGRHVHHECGNRTCVNVNHLSSVAPDEHLRHHWAIRKGASHAASV